MLGVFVLNRLTLKSVREITAVVHICDFGMLWVKDGNYYGTI